MIDVKRNAWESKNEEQIQRALKGNTDRKTYETDQNIRFYEILDWCEIKQNHVGFEIGSGEGIIASLIAQKCKSMDCADISKTFLSKAEETCAKNNNIKFYLIENNYFNFWKSDHYDFGYSTNVFIHFNPYDIFLYLNDVKRILKPNGIFHFDAICFGPDTRELFIDAAAQYKSDPSMVRGLLNFNHPIIIKRIINEVGFDLVEKSVWGDWMKIIVKKRGEV